MDKIILISACLPPAGIPSEELKKFDFAGSKIYSDGKRATSKDGTLAGSVMLLPDVVEHLKEIWLYSPQLVENTYN